MNIQTLHDFRGAYPEDGCCVSPKGTFAVLTDGCSECYCLPDKPPFIYPGGLTGGQMVSNIVKRVFLSAHEGDSLETLILEANEQVWRIQKEQRGDSVSRDNAGTLAGASFSCVRFSRGSARVVWGADVFTVWKTKSGEVGIVGGDNLTSELERERRYRDLIEGAGSRDQARKRYFLEVYPELKRKQDNVLYACLNGQLAISQRWNVCSLPDNTELIILLSDGAWIPMEEWGNNDSVAREFVNHYEEGGLADALAWVRTTQNKGLSGQRLERPEATILSISIS